MDRKILLVVSVLSGILSVSGITSVSANSSAGKIKNYLLMAEDQVSDINNCNTNDDEVVNILDVCRLKRDILNVQETTTAPVTTVTTEYNKTGYVNFEFGNPETSSDGKLIKMPILIKNNTIGIISVQMNINCDDRYFEISSIEQGDKGGRWTYSGNSSIVQFDSDNGSEITSDGVIGYIVFDVQRDTPSSTYVFSASGLQAVTLLNNDNSRPVTVGECPDTIYDRYIWYNNTQPVTTTMTTPVTTVTTTMPVTTATTTMPVTTVITTMPVTTVTTTTPVTTIPATTPVVTTTQPQITAEKSAIEMELVGMINEWRRELNLSPLEEYDVLFYCTDIRAKELSECYDMKRPDGSSVMDLLRTNRTEGWFKFCDYYNKGINDASRLLSQFKSVSRSNPGLTVDNPLYTRIGVGFYDGYWDIILT